MRLGRTMAWVPAVATIMLAAVTGAVVAFGLHVGGFGPDGALFPFPFAAMAVVGALVAVRHPRNLTGWLFVGTGLLMVLNSFALAYVQYAARGHQLPAVHVMAWLSVWLWMIPGLGVVLILMVFPIGRLSSPGWQWCARMTWALMLVITSAALPMFAASTNSLITADSIAHIKGGALIDVLGRLIALTFPLGFAALAVRFARSRDIERQQLKWFVFGAGLLVVAVLVDVVLNMIDNQTGGIAVSIGIAALPVAAGIGILRYRLYDIDRIISRTLSYSVVTAVLAGTFALCVLVPTAAIGSQTKTPSWVVAAGTLAVAILFQPLRSRVQRGVDHRFNRARYDAARTIDAFKTRLRDEIDIDALRDELRDVVGRTMQPSHVSLWVRGA